MKLQIVLSLICALNLVEVQPLRKLKRKFRKGEFEREKTFLEGVVASKRSTLSRPPILIATDNNTPRELLNVEHNSGGNSTRVSVGIIVENYSTYRLQDARASSPCSANREIFHVGDVDPGTSQFYAFDNGAWTHYGTCGAISWQINDPSGNPGTRLGTARRLVLTYHVPYKTTCGTKLGTAHAFSINVKRTYANGTGHWKYPELVKTHYKNNHNSGTRGTWGYDDGTFEALTMFDHDRFLVDGTMERGCKPLLTIQFAPSSKEKENLWDGKPFNSKRVHNESDNYVEASTASLEKMVWYVMIATVGSFAIIVAFFVARGIAKRVKERRRGRSAGL